MSSKHHIIASLENFFLPTPVFHLPEGHTYDLQEYTSTKTPEELKERIKHAEIVIINRIVLGADILDDASLAPDLRLIVVTAVGTDTVDKDACRRRGITVTNMSGVNTSAVAEHAMGLYFSVRRFIPYTHRLTQASEWKTKGLVMSTVMNGPDNKAPRGCKDEVVGIMGHGAIGKKIASLAQALGMKVLISGRKGQTTTPESGRVPFDQVIATASVIILSLPLTPDTRNLLSAPQFDQMQKDCVLVNVSRGGVVDEEALLDALERRQIAGAATDVYAVEPVGEDVSPLIGERAARLNLVTTPHSAWCAEETLQNSNRTVQANVDAWVAGEPVNVVS